MIHYHEYKIAADYPFDNDKIIKHRHVVNGYTTKIIGFSRLHCHYYRGWCSYAGHSHPFFGITGLPINTEKGHIHKICGTCELSLDHSHRFSGYTFEQTSSTGKTIPCVSKN